MLGRLCPASVDAGRSARATRSGRGTWLGSAGWSVHLFMVDAVGWTTNGTPFAARLCRWGAQHCTRLSTTWLPRDSAEQPTSHTHHRAAFSPAVTTFSNATFLLSTCTCASYPHRLPPPAQHTIQPLPAPPPIPLRAPPGYVYAAPRAACDITPNIWQYDGSERARGTAKLPRQQPIAPPVLQFSNSGDGNRHLPLFSPYPPVPPHTAHTRATSRTTHAVPAFSLPAPLHHLAPHTLM